MSLSVLTEHANRSDALAGLPLRADQARPMGELGPVLSTPIVVVVATAYAVGMIIPAAAGDSQPK